MSEKPEESKPEDEGKFDTGFGEEGTQEIPVSRQEELKIGETDLTSGYGEETTELIAPKGIAPHARLFGSPTNVPPRASFREQQTDEMPVQGVFRSKTNVKPAEPKPLPANGGKSALRGLLLVLLFTWASVATFVAVWLWLKWPPSPGALENLPDDGQLQGQITSPIEALSARQMVPMGKSLATGWLEVTPLWIECRPVTILPERFITEPVLILHLRLKNLSKDQAFTPADPAFLYPMNGKKLAGLPMFNSTGYSYTFLHKPERPESLILPYDLPYTLPQTIEGQEFTQLGPGESTDIIVVSAEDAYQQIGERMIWRVKLRKGRAPDGRGVATVIGIPFRKMDITAVSKDPLEPLSTPKSG